MFVMLLKTAETQYSKGFGEKLMHQLSPLPKANCFPERCQGWMGFPKMRACVFLVLVKS
jgi:hypothetical protein